jgi:AcrR family transcriptional regulator
VARPGGLREQKKRATREALRTAALRLALERGPDDVRVSDIAEAAGVSPRTYNNYFSSREQAIAAAVTSERESRIAAAVAARAAGVRLSEAVTDAVVEQYTAPGEQARDVLLLLTTRPAIRDAFLATPAAVEEPLAEAIAARVADSDGPTPQVLAACVAAAVRVALARWTGPAPTASGLLIPTGSLPELLRVALSAVAPALDAAE